MEYKKQIVQNVSSEIKSLFSQNINSLVDIAVNQKLEEEKYKFYEKLNICQEEFPTPTEQGIIRFCGCCKECTLNYSDSNTLANAKSRQLQRQQNIDLLTKIIIHFELLKDEYLLLCKLEPCDGASLNNPAYILSNYGRAFSYNLNGGGACPPYGKMVYTEPSPINQEYLKILSILKLHVYNGNNNWSYNYQLLSELIYIYREYHPRATEIFTIEQKTLKLKNKEIEI